MHGWQGEELEAGEGGAAEGFRVKLIGGVVGGAKSGVKGVMQIKSGNASLQCGEVRAPTGAAKRNDLVLPFLTIRKSLQSLVEVRIGERG